MHQSRCYVAMSRSNNFNRFLFEITFYKMKKNLLFCKEQIIILSINKNDQTQPEFLTCFSILYSTRGRNVKILTKLFKLILEFDKNSFTKSEAVLARMKVMFVIFY